MRGAAAPMRERLVFVPALAHYRSRLARRVENTVLWLLTAALCWHVRRLSRSEHSIAAGRFIVRKETGISPQCEGEPMNAAFKLGAIAAITSVILSAASLSSTVTFAQDGTRIRIPMGDQAATATLNNSEAARDLAAMLPLSIRMRDHLRREKTGPIPGPLSERTEGSPHYQSGDLGYWRPGGNFVIFYRHDGLTIPSPGIVLLGRVDSGPELFEMPGPVEVTVELIK
jgi:hypothetical protein